MNNTISIPKKFEECERKFMVKDDTYKNFATHHFYIQQGYLCKDPMRTVRIRISNDKAFITVKSLSKTSMITHFEWEKEIVVSEALQLLHLCITPIIEKTRWVVPTIEGLTWEVDEFHAPLSNLILAEIELAYEHQIFTKPSFIGEEVTHNMKYYNVNI